MEKKIKETIPFWLATAITAVLSLPLGLYLGKFNVPLWVTFIVWAQFFLYGAKLDSWKTIFPCFAAGALFSTLGMVLAALLMKIPALAAANGLPAIGIGFGLAVCIMVYCMRFYKTFQTGSLSYFNGMAMMLAVYFTNSYPHGGTFNITFPIIAGLWTILVGWFGVLVGWFNVKITFPRQV